jgi:hypothetical protein
MLLTENYLNQPFTRVSQHSVPASSGEKRPRVGERGPERLAPGRGGREEGDKEKRGGERKAETPLGSKPPPHLYIHKEPKVGLPTGQREREEGGTRAPQGGGQEGREKRGGRSRDRGRRRASPRRIPSPREVGERIRPREPVSEYASIVELSERGRLSNC